MRVLLTGAFGNVGQSTLKKLIELGHEVICFDLKSATNEKVQKKLAREMKFDIVWGDITKPDQVTLAVKDVDVIIHLAAIIPPLSEKIPEITRKVNVDGTKNLIEAAKALEKRPRFIVASSISVYGCTMNLAPPRTVEDVLCPTDYYSQTKVEVEELLKSSGLPWLILRLGAVSIQKIPSKLDPILFEIPLEQRIEFVDSRDVGTAFANAVTVNAENKIFLIGGGKGCQLYQKEFVQAMLNAVGIPMLPESAFRTAKKDHDWFYTDWIDTEESQKLLKFQNITFKDYIEELKREIALRRFGIRLVAPFAKLGLLFTSPYYKSAKKNSIPVLIDDYKYLKQLIDDSAKKISSLESKVANLESQLKQLKKS